MHQLANQLEDTGLQGHCQHRADAKGRAQQHAHTQSGQFNAELDAYKSAMGDDLAHLYEDAYTSRIVKDFKMSKSGILTWVEEEREMVKGQWSYVPRKQREQMWDEDDAREWLKFWRAALRRAKKYDSMPTEVLDAIQDGERDDIEIDD